jgi:hypothetical protein
MRPTYNRLRAKMTCLYCGEFAEMNIEMYFGEFKTKRVYTVGDRCHWLPNQEIQDGGRPEGGNMDGEGFAWCSTCGHDFFVKILVRDDIITDVIQNNEKNNQDEFHDYFPDRRQPAQAVDLSREAEPKERGKVTFSFEAGWLTDKRQAALSQLTQLGVNIYSLSPAATDLNSMRIMIPHDLRTPEYIDIAYLMARLLDENFQHPPVKFVDSYPHGMKYRVSLPDDE